MILNTVCTWLLGWLKFMTDIIASIIVVKNYVARRFVAAGITHNVTFIY